MDVTMESRRRRTHGTPYSFAALFEPDTVLPGQFFSARRRQLTGEERLALAIVEDAVKDATIRVDHPDWKERHLRTTALDWFRADDRAWLFSFVNICDVLNFDAGAVRAAVLAGTARADGPSVRVVAMRRQPGTNVCSPQRLTQKREWAQRRRDRERAERAQAQL